MTTLIERARQWGEERDQEWLQKGMRKGLQKGMRKGLRKGMQKGMRKGLRKGMEKGIERGRTEGERELARRLARDRFGPGAAQELSRVLDESAETTEVPGIVKLIFECETAEEFLRRIREA